jgi:hypothetical protein
MPSTWGGACGCASLPALRSGRSSSNEESLWGASPRRRFANRSQKALGQGGPSWTTGPFGTPVPVLVLQEAFSSGLEGELSWGRERRVATLLREPGGTAGSLLGLMLVVSLTQVCRGQVKAGAADEGALQNRQEDMMNSKLAFGSRTASSCSSIGTEPADRTQAGPGEVELGMLAGPNAGVSTITLDLEEGGREEAKAETESNGSSDLPMVHVLEWNIAEVAVGRGGKRKVIVRNHGEHV